MAAVILIPAYNPNHLLVEYVSALVSFGFERILVINDGSKAECNVYFDRVREFEQCDVITHEVNRGKGAALKTGMSYYLEHYKGYDGIVTGDADGQHTLEDTANLAGQLSKHPDALLLGSRVFTGDDVPKRSAFGNNLTSKVFHLFYGKKLGDTQTGLRAIPNALIEGFIDLNGDRFEYEMNMLIMCADKKIDIIEFPIKTVYIDDNSSSHFNVIKDSVKIYWIILKRFILYLVSGIISFIVDQGVYRLLIYILLPLLFAKILKPETAASIYIATAVARVVSSVVNFFINKVFVFESKSKTTKSFVKYVILVVGIMLTSASLVWAISSITHWNSANVKIVVDALLVFVTYTLQRCWVFKKK